MEKQNLVLPPLFPNMYTARLWGMTLITDDAQLVSMLGISETDPQIIDTIRTKYRALLDQLDACCKDLIERKTWAGSEPESLAIYRNGYVQVWPASCTDGAPSIARAAARPPR